MTEEKKRPSYILYEETNDGQKVVRRKVGAIWEFDKNGKKRLRISLNLFSTVVFLSAYPNEPKEEQVKK